MNRTISKGQGNQWILSKEIFVGKVSSSGPEGMLLYLIFLCFKMGKVIVYLY